MTPQDADRYDRLIFDGARDLAVRYGQDVNAMRLALTNMGITDHILLYAVEEAQVSPDYELDTYRGAMCDEGVIETLKDCLRPLYGF